MDDDDDDDIVVEMLLMEQVSGSITDSKDDLTQSYPTRPDPA